MFDQNGLSLDQAPPIAVVLRFYVMGASFGVIAGAYMAWQGMIVLEPYSFPGRIMTHLMTLGVMLSFMLGALFQMLPVVAGVALQSPVKLSVTIQIPFAVGVVSLLWGFESGAWWAFAGTIIFLGIPLGVLALFLTVKLFRMAQHSAASRGIRMALVALGIVVVLGVYLAGAYGGVWNGELFFPIRVTHYSFGLFGWMALLIVAISFQVVEMFYVTPPHPEWMRRGLPGAFVVLLAGASVGQFWFPVVWDIADPLLGLLLLIYAGITLRRFSQRKRPLADATVWFWRMGLGSLAAFALLLLLSSLGIGGSWMSALMSITFTAFVLSILLAMLYKIIPFLTWFHLNAQGYLTAPMMHEVIHPKTAKKHLYIHAVTFGLLLVSLPFPVLAHAAGAGLMVSFGWLLYQIVHAYFLYRYVQRTGQRFEMPILK